MARKKFSETFDPDTLLKGRFIVSPYEVMQDPRVQDTAYRVFMALMSFSKPSGAPVKVSTLTLSKLLHKSRQVINRCLRELELLGYIIPEGVGVRSRIYHFPHKDLYKRAAHAARHGMLSELSELNDKPVSVPANWANSVPNQDNQPVDNPVDNDGGRSVYLAIREGENSAAGVLSQGTPLYTINSEDATYGTYGSSGSLHGDNRFALDTMPAADSPEVDALSSTGTEPRTAAANSADIWLRTTLQTILSETFNGVERAMASIRSEVVSLSESVAELRSSGAAAGAGALTCVGTGVRVGAGAGASVSVGADAISATESQSPVSDSAAMPLRLESGAVAASEGVGQGDSLTGAEKTPQSPEIEPEPEYVPPTFDCAGDVKTFTPSEEDVSRWQQAFPGVDVRAALLRARAWVDADPKRRKTARGMKRYLTAWLGRDQDRGTYRNSLAVRNNQGKNADGSPRRLSGNLMDAGLGGESLTAWLERAVPGGGVIDGKI